MAIVNLLTSIAKPTGLWETIIFWIEKGVVNYGLTIILFTCMIKLILSPLDYIIKYSSKKTSLIQKKLSPQTVKLQKKYANNQTAYNAQLNMLYKKEGLNMVASCVVMLVNLVVTLVVFFTMFASMRNIASYKMIEQYNVLNETYKQYETTAEAEDAVVVKYAEIKDDFLWIQNIWRPDTWSTIIPTYSELKSAVKSSGKVYTQYVTNEINEEQYEKVMSPIRENNKGWNGYLILAVVVALLSYLSQKITEVNSDIKGVKDPVVPQNQTMKIMKFLLPAMMVIFVLTSNSAFGLYLVASSFIGILTSFVTNVIVKKTTRKLEEETKQVLLKQELKNK